MDSGVWVALIAVFGAQLGALILGFQTARERRLERARAAQERREERQTDFERSEAVRIAVVDAASKAQEAAELLAERDRRQAAEAAAAVIAAEEVARIAAEHETETQMKLDQIHILVNSGLTDTRREVLEEMERVRELLQKLADANTAAGIETTPAELATLRETDVRIETQKAILADRAEQQAKVDEQAKRDTES